jgi:hypothetical protein
MGCDGVRWGAMGCDGARCVAMGCDGLRDGCIKVARCRVTDAMGCVTDAMGVRWGA